MTAVGHNLSFQLYRKACGEAFRDFRLAVEHDLAKQSPGQRSYALIPILIERRYVFEVLDLPRQTLAKPVPKTWAGMLE